MSKKIDSNQDSSRGQHLSDLLDNCATSEAIGQVLSDEQDCETWYRYNLVSSVLKREESAFSDYEFTQSIAVQVANEPAIISRPKQVSPVIQFWKRAGGGFAVAASVAFAMVFSVQMLDTSSDLGGDIVTNSPLPTTSVSDDAFVSKPAVISAAEAEEQARLDEIQTILNSMGSNPNVYEQKVGGEVIYSTVIKTNQEDKQEALRNSVEGDEKNLDASDN